MSYLKSVLIAFSILAATGCNSSSPTSISSIRIDPVNASVQAGQSAQLVVVGENGGPITAGVSWSSSNPVMASITSSGEVSGGYDHGAVTITANVRSASATSVVDVQGFCLDVAPFEGSPNPGVAVQSFDVRFVPGTDGVKRANELAALAGFSPSQVTSEGFSATLTPIQAAAVSCSQDVAGLTYL
jgi:hypothetical protein